MRLVLGEVLLCLLRFRVLLLLLQCFTTLTPRHGLLGLPGSLGSGFLLRGLSLSALSTTFRLVLLGPATLRRRLRRRRLSLRPIGRRGLSCRQELLAKELWTDPRFLDGVMLVSTGGSAILIAVLLVAANRATDVLISSLLIVEVQALPSPFATAVADEPLAHRFASGLRAVVREVLRVRVGLGLERVVLARALGLAIRRRRAAFAPLRGDESTRRVRRLLRAMCLNEIEELVDLAQVN